MSHVERIIHSEDATLLYYPDSKIIHHRFHKPISSEIFRHVLQAGITTLRANNAHKWLSDDRGNGPLSPEDTEWGQTTWFEEAKAAGWTTWALVVPMSLMGRLNMREIYDGYRAKGITSRVFSDPMKALEWLSAQ